MSMRVPEKSCVSGCRINPPARWLIAASLLVLAKFSKQHGKLTITPRQSLAVLTRIGKLVGKALRNLHGPFETLACLLMFSALC